MSNSKQRRGDRRNQVQGKGKAWVDDSYQNLMARVGLGAGNQAGGGYAFDNISRNRTTLEAAYQSNWVAATAVDVVAEDMTREGIDVKTSLDPDELDKITQAMDNMGLWDALCDTIKWSRLYGGALAVILIDGQDNGTPLRLDTIGKDQFKGLLVLDRWLVQPTLQQLVCTYGEGFGMPKFYDVVADGLALRRQRIHHSRVIRIDGVDLPYWRKTAENLWGASVLEKMWDRIVAFDSATMGASQLVYKAHLRTVKLPDLRLAITMGGPSMEAVVKHLEMIRTFQTNEGLTVLDASDTFETSTYTFAGLSDMLLQFGQQISGALQIPLVRLFGQSPAGLNASGDSDLKTYHDNIKRQQERKLRSGVAKLLDVVSRSVLGAPIPEGTTFTFTSLHQLSAEQKATVAQNVTTAVLAAEESGLVNRSTALKELKQSSHVTGVWTNISDKEIKEAENDPPPGSESVLGNPNAQEQDPDARPVDRQPQEGDPQAAASRA
jgi:uncharacterized protein